MFRTSFDRPLRPRLVASVVFLLAAIAVTTMIWRAEQRNRREERAQVSALAGDHMDLLQRNSERALSATHALAAFVRQGNGAMSNFDVVGNQMLPYYPGVTSLSLAPKGIIDSVVPRVGNDEAIGLDLLHAAETKAVASSARESGKLTLTEPFASAQGDLAVAGRLPVFLDDRGGRPYFWGFINVVVSLPAAAKAAGLSQLAERGTAYQLWHNRPDTGQRQLIAAVSPAHLADPVELNADLPWGSWTLSAAPATGWGGLLGFSLRAAVGLLFCLLLAYVAKLLVEAKAHERELEGLVAQRTAEVKMREADLNRAQSVARVGSWVFDFARKEFHGSNEALRILGLDGEGSFDFKAFMERVHADDRSIVDRALQAANRGEPYDIEYRIVVGAAVCWVHSYAETTFAADSTPQRALGTVQDITERKRREQELRHFRAAMDASADAIYLIDRASMRYIDVNQAACRMQCCTKEELLALGPVGVLSISLEELAHTYDSIIAGGPGAEPVEMLRGRKDGSQAWVELRRRAQRFGDSWIIVSAVRDITERKQTEQALRESAAQLRLFTDNVPAMTVAYDANLRCHFVNKRFAEFFGFTVESALGKHLRDVVGERTFGMIAGYYARVLQGHPVTYQRTHKLANGEPCHLEIKLLPHTGDHGQALGCFSVAADITEHKQAEERIRHMAHHDSLTGLPNRSLFNDRLKQAISLARRESRQFALLYLDLDKFKPVNDTLGHAAGDDVLKVAAARIRGQVRASDTVARVGGDEFTVILPHIASREEAETVAAKIIAALATPFPLGGANSVDIGTSIGIAVYPLDAANAEALVTAADAAMYHAKQAGSGIYRCCAA